MSQQQVEVYVDDGSRITCVPDELYVDRPNTRIVWRLKTSGYVFPNDPHDAIQFKRHPNEFDQPNIFGSRTRVSFRDRKSKLGLFPYSVTVVDGDGNSITVDPSIKNRPSVAKAVVVVAMAAAAALCALAAAAIIVSEDEELF